MATGYSDLLMRGPPGPNEDLLLRGTPDPNADMMPMATNFDTVLSDIMQAEADPPADVVPTKPTDRITKALQRAIKPQMDVLTAFAQSSTGKTTFGDVYNQMRASEIRERQQLLEALNTRSLLQSRKERTRLSQENLELREQELALKRTEHLAKVGLEGPKAVMEVLEKLVPQRDRAKAMYYVSQQPEEIKTAQDAYRLMPGMIARAAEQGVISTVEPAYDLGIFEDKERIKAKYRQGESLSVTTPEGATFTMTKGQAGKRNVDAETARINAINFVREAMNLTKKLGQVGDQGIGVAGGLSRMVDSVVSQGRALAKMSGVDLTDYGLPKEYKWKGPLADEAVASADLKSKLVSLAYSIALLKNGERPTDKDVAAALDMLGANSGSARQMSAAIQSMLTDAMESWAVRYREQRGKDFNWEAALGRNGIAMPGTDPTSVIPPGAQTATNPTTGEQMWFDQTTQQWKPVR